MKNEIKLLILDNNIAKFELIEDNLITSLNKY